MKEMTVDVDNLKAKDFYNNFDKKLIQDFISGNKRIIEAISFIKSTLAIKQPGRILDIGCGLGWTTYEMAEYFPAATVMGIDLSDNLIEHAKLLFNRPNTIFSTQDLTETWDAVSSKFEAVTLVDVFEHIPAGSRIGFYNSLKNKVADKFTIILTCPTVMHQEYLRNFEPGGLQPVDEDVDVNVLLKFANALGADLVHFSYKSIWKANDYFHAVISNNEQYGLIPHVPEISILPKSKRIELLKCKGFNVADYGYNPSVLGSVKKMVQSAWKK